jgi:hypothetical protein
MAGQATSLKGRQIFGFITEKAVKTKGFFNAKTPRVKIGAKVFSEQIVILRAPVSHLRLGVKKFVVIAVFKF